MSQTQRRYRQYAKASDAQIDGDRRIILNALLRNARGYGNRVSAKDLAEFTDINDSTVRDVIIELREEFNVPVANLGSGYFVNETSGELERVVDYYNGEIVRGETYLSYPNDECMGREAIEYVAAKDEPDRQFIGRMNQLLPDLRDDE